MTATIKANGKPPANRIARFVDDPRAAELTASYEAARAAANEAEKRAREWQPDRAPVAYALDDFLPAEPPPPPASAKGPGSPEDRLARLEWQMAEADRVREAEEKRRQAEREANANPHRETLGILRQIEHRGIQAIVAYRAEWSRREIEANRERMAETLVAEARAVATYRDALAAREALRMELGEAGMDPLNLSDFMQTTSTAAEESAKLARLAWVAQNYATPAALAAIVALGASPDVFATSTVPLVRLG